MTIYLQTKPGINGANTLSVPDKWDKVWFRRFIANLLKGADVRNAVGENGIVVSGNISSPYATISTGGTGPATFASLVVGTPTGGNEGAGSINAQSIYINGVPISGSSSVPFNVTPDTHTSAVPTFPATDYFEETSLDTAGTRFAGATPWTWLNQSTATATVHQGAVQISTALAAAENVNAIIQPMALTGGNGRWRAKIVGYDQEPYNNGGMYLYESGTGKVAQFGLVNFNGTPTIWIEYAASVTAAGNIFLQGSASGMFLQGAGVASIPVWLEIELNGSTLIFRYSFSGYDGSFFQFDTAPVTSLFTTAPDHVGLGGYAFNSTFPSILFCDTFIQEA